MRIAIFSESFAPLLNGVAVSVCTLTEELERSGHDVYVFAPGIRGNSEENDKLIRFPSFTTWFEPDYPITVPFRPGITELVRKLDLDIIHTQTPWALGWLGLRIARRLGLPIVSTNHTQYTKYAHYFPLAPRAITSAFIAGNMRRYYNRCDSVVVPSNVVGEMLQEYGVRTPIRTIQTGNALNTFRDETARADIRSHHNIGPNDKVLLYVGRLAKEKNLQLLLHSFDRVASRFPDTVLLIAGGGPFESACRKMAAGLNSGRKVIFTGALPREVVAKYYSAGDIFVFPSTTETQGLVLSEALMSGLPCVAVNAGGGPEVLTNGDDSLLTEDRIDDFTAKIELLLTDKDLRERLSIRATQNAERFAPSNMATRMLDFYGSACDCVKGRVIRSVES